MGVSDPRAGPAVSLCELSPNHLELCSEQQLKVVAELEPALGINLPSRACLLSSSSLKESCK